MTESIAENKFSTNFPDFPNAFSRVDLSPLYESAELDIIGIEYLSCENTYHAYAQFKSDSGVCPYCGSTSHSVHSRYFRTVSDLSILGNRVIITIHSRKFFCHNPDCKKKTFAEQPGNEVFRYRRRTRRCEIVVSKNGLYGSSSKAASLLSTIGIQLSPSTVLRDVHRMCPNRYKEVTRIGVDDWAFRKGLVYGSIIVNLDTGEVIDLLDDRSESTFRCWLDEHVEVKLVSRDRSTDFSTAVQSTGRDIIEVADRFHLVKNMSDCVAQAIRDNYKERWEHTYDRLDVEKPPRHIMTSDPRRANFDAVKHLQKNGFGKVEQIAKKVGISPPTALKYMRLDTFPERVATFRNPYAQYEAYVKKQFKKGHSLNSIYFDIKKQGFTGGLAPYFKYFKYLLDQKEKVQKKSPPPSVRELSIAIDKSMKNKKLSEQEIKNIDAFMTKDWFKTIYDAAISFYAALKYKDSTKIKEWAKCYADSNITQLKRTAYGITKDIEAVSNCVEMDVSNGIVEGFVNKLKEVKRSMYGRAKIDLLRRKMVLPDVLFN